MNAEEELHNNGSDNEQEEYQPLSQRIRAQPFRVDYQRTNGESDDEDLQPSTPRGKHRKQIGYHQHQMDQMGRMDHLHHQMGRLMRAEVLRENDVTIVGFGNT